MSSLLDPLDPEQRAVASALHGPVVVIAGAGTGKTRAITHRIAHGVQQGVYTPHQLLAVTFTQRAAGEMRTRLARLGAGAVQARTFHSAALRQLRYFWPQTYGGEVPEITASKIGLVTEAARASGISGDLSLWRDLASEIEWSKVSNIGPDQYESRAARAGREVAGLTADEVGRVIRAYENVKRERGRIDMEDILLLTAALLAGEPQVAAQVRGQYRHLVVDEFQDVSPLQFALLSQWLGDRNDVCVVGDPLQTIYSFAGASADYLTGFAQRFPGAERIELVRNYRSTPQIVRAANRVFAGSRSGGVELLAQRESGPEVVFTEYGDEAAEATAITHRIAALRDQGASLRSMAILFRVNAQSEAFEAALGEQNIGYVVRGVERFFDRPEVRQAVALIRAAARAEPETSGDLGREIGIIVSSMGYAETAPVGKGAVRDRWESLHALVSMAADLPAGATLADLAADLERRAESAHAPAAEGVTLTTMHAAKGLEWDHVFCAGMHEGTVPSPHARKPAEVAEERRLFYVGVTRARDTLSVSWSRSRAGRGQRKPTRFLDAVLPEGVRPERSRSAASPKRERKVGKCRVCGEPLRAGVSRKLGRCEDCPASYDEALFEALREWRLAEAAEQKKPAFVVFTDATLIAIAEERPRDRAALARINGVGAAKLDRYGEDVLRICAAGAQT